INRELVGRGLERLGELPVAAGLGQDDLAAVRVRDGDFADVVGVCGNQLVGIGNRCFAVVGPDKMLDANVNPGQCQQHEQNDGGFEVHVVVTVPVTAPL